MQKNTDEQPVDPIIEEYGRLSPEKLITLKSEEIAQRLKLIEELYNIYVDQWPSIYLNRYLLREAVESYFCDIYRLKFFRPVNRINEHKKAAYTMKWLSRVRPVQVHDGFGADSPTLMVNAFFALIVGLELLGVKYDARDDDWWTTFIRETTYLLHYHSVSVETLTQAMCVLKEFDTARK